MARALSKVQKQVAKKRGGKLNALHENSRDSKRLRRAGMREEKIARLMQAARSANQIYVDRVAWFQDLIAESDYQDIKISDEALQGIASEYANRFDEDLAELKSQRRPGRPPSSQEDRIRQQQEADLKELKAGLWIPDIRSLAVRKRLGNWNGEWSGLNTLKFVRVVKDDQIRDSSFPPKGLS